MRDLLRMWPAFDPADISGSWAILEPALVALVQARGNQSSQLAARFYAEQRSLEVAGEWVARFAPTPSAADVAASLRYTGPQHALKLVQQGRTDVSKVTFTDTAGNVTRLTMNQGRDTTLANVAADPDAKGYRRITSGNACEFCRMLAGRGAVYQADTVDFRAHGHCGCTAEPVFAGN